MTRSQKFFAGFAAFGGALLGLELYGVYGPGDGEDTITQLLIEPVMNFDVVGFPVGWTVYMGLLVWLGVHSHRRRRKGI